MTHFFQTAMGKRFFEGTMPALVEQLERLNEKMDRNLEDNEKWLGGQMIVPDKFTCPKCGAQHERGWFDAQYNYRCLKCGYAGPNTTSDKDASDENEELTSGMSDFDYLSDLSDRLMKIPVMHGVDQGDADRLHSIKRSLEALRKQVRELTEERTNAKEVTEEKIIRLIRLLNSGCKGFKQHNKRWWHDDDVLRILKEWLETVTPPDKKSPAEDALDKLSEAMTDAVNANEAQQMANELEHYLFHTKRGSLETDGSVLRKVTDIILKWGYGRPKEQNKDPLCSNCGNPQSTHHKMSQHCALSYGGFPSEPTTPTTVFKEEG